MAVPVSNQARCAGSCIPRRRPLVVRRSRPGQQDTSSLETPDGAGGALPDVRHGNEQAGSTLSPRIAGPTNIGPVEGLTCVDS